MNFKFIALAILMLVATINFTRTTLEIINSSKRLDELKSEVLSMQEEKTELEEKIKYKKSDDYVEKTARNELNLIKEGETVYVLSGTSKPEGAILSAKNERHIEPLTVAGRVKNLKLWWHLFL